MSKTELTEKQRRLYLSTYDSCQAGGMSNQSSHDYAMEMAERKEKTPATRNLYLIEFYTNSPEDYKGPCQGGWDINFAWVYAHSKDGARTKLILNQGDRFDCVIACEQHAEITPLAGNFRVNTPDANLFILN